MTELMKNLREFVESATGVSIETIDRETLDESRARVEQKSGKKMRIVSMFPFIGRGNVMSRKLLSRESIERDLDKCLK